MLEIQDWGLIDYEIAWNRQKELVEEIQSKRDRSALVLCEHPSVITIGRNGSEQNISVSCNFLDNKGIKVIKNDRGGDITLHNPGQLVGYPIFNLSDYKEDLHWFLRQIESCLIELLNKYNIESHIIEGMTGVWIQGRRKIAAIGLHCSRWVTSHGFALNINNNLEEFEYIIPCGIKDKEVTSMAKEIGTLIDMNKVKKECIKVFGNISV
jgi:lipoyl(octanoyl) transferase